MNDRIKCLYDFTCCRRMGALSQDEEYQKYCKSVQMQRKLVSGFLNEQQIQGLNLLLWSISAQNALESKCFFHTNP